MKFKKAYTEILFEALNNGIEAWGNKGKLLCSCIGTCEVVVGEQWVIEHYTPCKEYETDYFLAGQLPTGEIVWIDNNNKVHSLKDDLVNIWWGYYPDGFPEEKKTKRPCPEAFKPYSERKPVDTTFATVEDNELPF